MDNIQYCEKAIKKIETYNRNGIFQGDRLLITYETSTQTLNMRNFEILIEKYLI